MIVLCFVAYSHQHMQALVAQIRVTPETGIELPTALKKHLHRHSFGRPSRFIRKLVHILFPNTEELANSSCLGQKTGDHAAQALDPHRVGIIRGELTLTHKEWALSQVTSDTHKEWALSQVTSHVLTKSGHYHWWPQLLSKSGHYHRWPLTYSQIVGIITGDPSLTHKRWVLFWVIIGEHWLSYSPVIIVHPLSVPSETRDRFALWAYMRKCQYLALNLCCGSGDHVKWQSSHLRKGDVKEHMKLTCTLAVTTFITPYNAI